MAKNPSWKFKFWTDREREAPCKGMETVFVDTFPLPHLERCYQESRNWGEKSDILRFEILYREGGVYADHDANCLKPFDGLHRAYDFYCGFETPHPPFAGYNVTCGNGVIGARPHHPVVKEVIDLIASRWDALAQKYPGTDGFSRTQIVMERTYIALTQALKTNKLSQEGNTDIVFPAAYLFAKSGIPCLYSKHFFADSWASEEKKNTVFERQTRHDIHQIDHNVSRLFLFSVPLLCFNVILIALLVRFFKKGKSS
jgi:hypothetical protein